MNLMAIKLEEDTRKYISCNFIHMESEKANSLLEESSIEVRRVRGRLPTGTMLLLTIWNHIWC